MRLRAISNLSFLTHASTKQPYVTSLTHTLFNFMSSNMLKAFYNSFYLPYALISIP